ncbi:uncharacterized protein EI90DRAFT_1511356 [Cantharellus anzutake]|uniref:uncharacterized protein n=1 Tax=Cantharellus anzutake TaxID=1750568 RepID=UPI001907EBCB|nr:uncharacterized protein EI90DRAFT_1511356 [Cantharellus anzutake]KAF8328666.1 hypothetical protein EI90DRAFT_1511356 [Cantharellus anzutake]
MLVFPHVSCAVRTSFLQLQGTGRPPTSYFVRHYVYNNKYCGDQKRREKSRATRKKYRTLSTQQKETAQCTHGQERVAHFFFPYQGSQCQKRKKEKQATARRKHREPTR